MHSFLLRTIAREKRNAIVQLVRYIRAQQGTRYCTVWQADRYALEANISQFPGLSELASILARDENYTIGE